ncbi:hypothetical protein ACFC08_35925 [Streptomyces sp. NPDC056112]|uniref:hypothetical protein n=1 Tax=unclassified Streptomyces TaxID=2593676 RepID=UPI001CD72EA5|nr:hypothetical protein [Streptomyces sp. CoT10]
MQAASPPARDASAGPGSCMSHQEPESAAYTVEVKAALARYLAPLIGTEARAVRR